MAYYKKCTIYFCRITCFNGSKCSGCSSCFINNVPAETTCIERTKEDDDTYSGWSENYSLHATETLQASVLLAANKKSIFYWLANPTITNKNKNESIPIYLVQNGEEVSFENGGNIGHYGVIYHFAMTLKNNTNKTVKFKGYILSNNKSLCAGIQSGSNADGYFLGSEGAGVGVNKTRWNFYESKALKPNEVLMPEFNYSVLSKGSGTGVIQFEVVEV